MENTIKKYREELNLSQSELAKKLKVSRETVNNIENKKTIPSLALANKIALELKISICDVFPDLHCN